MERRNEASGSGSGSNNHPRSPYPPQDADAELARLLQQDLAMAAAGANAPGLASAPSHLPPLTLHSFGMPPVCPPQQGFPEHPFPAVPFPPMANWSVYDPEAHAQLEQSLRQTSAHLPPESPLEANRQHPFFPPPPIASQLTTPVSQYSPTARRTSSAPSGTESPAADSTNSQGAQIPRTQAEMDALMVAEEKRRRNTAASARFRIKKKQKVTNLQRSLSDLQRRSNELEREATSLRRENMWLKEMVLMKGRIKTGKRQALEESPTAGGKRKGKVAVVEHEEEEDNDYISESDEESEEEDEA